MNNLDIDKIFKDMGENIDKIFQNMNIHLGNNYPPLKNMSITVKEKKKKKKKKKKEIKLISFPKFNKKYYKDEN